MLREMLYSGRLAEPGFSILSYPVKRKCCRVGMSNNKELEVQSALRR